jgi:Phosphopantetheine attachment site
MHQSMLDSLRLEAQQTAVAVWREVLGAAEIGLDDNVFDVGGNSLHVVEALRRLCDRLNIQLTVLDMFQHPTIRSLVHFLYPEPVSKREWDTATDRATRQWKALEGRRNPIKFRRNNHV